MKQEENASLAWGLVGALIVITLIGVMGRMSAVGVLVMMIVVCLLIWAGKWVIEQADWVNQWESRLASTGQRQPMRGVLHVIAFVVVMGGGAALFGGILWLGKEVG